MSKENIVNNFHQDAVKTFRGYKKLAERAMEQLSDDEFFALIDPESNSVAIMVKHIAGNQISRWTDLLTSDGEKPDRDRDTEFEITDRSRESLMKYWERDWQTLFAAIEPLTADHLEKQVTIRGEPHTVVEAINRQLTHYSYHIGQIIFLAKYLRSANWKTLSVPKNRSAEFNAFLAEKRAADSGNTDRLQIPESFAKK